MTDNQPKYEVIDLIELSIHNVAYVDFGWHM